jgi:hypothetical protein
MYLIEIVKYKECSRGQSIACFGYRAFASFGCSLAIGAITP